MAIDLIVNKQALRGSYLFRYARLLHLGRKQQCMYEETWSKHLQVRDRATIHLAELTQPEVPNFLTSSWDIPAENLHQALEKYVEQGNFSEPFSLVYPSVLSSPPVQILSATAFTRIQFQELVIWSDVEKMRIKKQQSKSRAVRRSDREPLCSAQRFRQESKRLHP